MNKFELYNYDGASLGFFKGNFDPKNSGIGEYTVYNVETNEALVIRRQRKIDYYFDQLGNQVGFND